MKRKSILQNLPLVLGIALPIGFIILVILMTYLPGRGIHPAHDFIYTQDQESMSLRAYKNEYRVEDNRIVLKPTGVVAPEREGVVLEEAPRLYRYNHETGAVQEISLEGVRDSMVTAGPTSPDGYNVEYRYSSGGIFNLLGGSSEENGYYLSKGGAGKRLPALSSNEYWYNSNIKVLGWVQ